MASHLLIFALRYDNKTVTQTNLKILYKNITLKPIDVAIKFPRYDLRPEENSRDILK